MSRQQKGGRDIGEYPLTAEIIVHLYRYLEYVVYLQKSIPDKYKRCKKVQGITASTLSNLVGW